VVLQASGGGLGALLLVIQKGYSMSLGPYDYKSVDVILARLKSMSLTKQQAEEIIELARQRVRR